MKLKVKYFLMACCLLFLMLTGAAYYPTRAEQSANQIPIVTKTEKVTPILLEEVLYKGEKAVLNDSVLSTNDWLSNLEFKIKSLSPKAIKKVKVGIIVVSRSEDFLGYGLSATFVSSKEKAELNLDESLILKVNPLDAEYLLSELAGKKIEELQVSVDFVNFDDGTAWSQGVILKQSEKKPGVYIREGVDEKDLEDAIEGFK